MMDDGPTWMIRYNCCSILTRSHLVLLRKMKIYFWMLTLIGSVAVTHLLFRFQKSAAFYHSTLFSNCMTLSFWNFKSLPFVHKTQLESQKDFNLKSFWVFGTISPANVLQFTVFDLSNGPLSINLFYSFVIWNASRQQQDRWYQADLIADAILTWLPIYQSLWTRNLISWFSYRQFQV